jgi:hypothetical protein
MHPSVQSMSTNMSRIAAKAKRGVLGLWGVQGKIVAAGTGVYLLQDVCYASRAIVVLQRPFPLGARKTLRSQPAQKGALSRAILTKFFEGTKLTGGVDVTAPGLGVDAAAGLRLLVVGVLGPGRTRGSSRCRGGIVRGRSRVVGVTRGGLVIRRWCVHAW